MRITESRLRSFIGEALLSEESLQANDQKQQVSLKKINPYIGPNVKIDPAATVANSAIGDEKSPADASAISGASNIANSTVVGNSEVVASDLNHSMVNQSTVSNSSLDDFLIIRTKFRGSTAKRKDVVTYSFGDVISDSDILNSNIVESAVMRSNIRGGSKIFNAQVEKCDLNGVTIMNMAAVSQYGMQIKDLTAIGAQITRTADDSDSGNMEIEKARIEWAEIINSSISGGAVIKGVQGAAPYIEGASVGGNVLISGKAQIIAYISPSGQKHRPWISNNARISGNAQVSGDVGGNAEISGDAKIYSTAYIGGSCKVSGTAVMMSGDYTSGVYTEGEWINGKRKRGEGPIDQLLSAAGL